MLKKCPQQGIGTQNTENQNSMEEIDQKKRTAKRAVRRCPWCNSYRRKKWTRRHEFESWTRLIAFHRALIPL